MKTAQKGFMVPLIIILIVALGIGGGVYYSQKVKSSPTTENSVAQQTQIESQPGVSTTTSILPKNDNIKIEAKEKSTSSLSRENIICTKENSYPSQGGVIFDTVYADGVMSRSDAVATYKGETTTQSTLYRDNYFYSWSSLHTTGTKEKITVGAADISNSTRQSNEAQGYVCRPWIRDASKFEVPAKIHFEDFGSVNLSPVSPEIMNIINENQNNNGYQPSDSDFNTLDNFFNTQSQ